jgi:hypothetical protein
MGMVGACVVLWHVRWHGASRGGSVLQARHQVRARFLLRRVALKHFTSITTWALKEAKVRMEARGEPTDYTAYKAARQSKLVEQSDA